MKQGRMYRDRTNVFFVEFIANISGIDIYTINNGGFAGFSDDVTRWGNYSTREQGALNSEDKPFPPDVWEWIQAYRNLTT